MQSFRAKYVLPIDGPPLRDGIVAIDGDRIVAVGEAKSAAMADYVANARDFGDALILPGLVNPHTHLEFSDLRLPLGMPGMAFPEWIREVVKFRWRQNEQLLAMYQRGLLELEVQNVENLPEQRGIHECLQCGVTAAGNIETAIRASGGGGEFIESAGESHNPLEITSFQEVISFSSKVREETNNRLCELLDFSASRWSATDRLGLSPHAPYSVHPLLIQSIVKQSRKRCVPIAHHLAESREELMLLRAGVGPFVDLLKYLDAWDPTAIPFGSKPLDYLKLLSTAHRALVIHGNYLDDEEIEFVAAHRNNMSVVYCPRTQAYFDHDPYPLAKMIAAGVNVALGTDSRASNPDLAPLGELRFAARQHPLIGPRRLLEMITLHAAEALGREAEIGSLLPGKFADLAVLSLPKQHTGDPHETLLDASARVIATIFRGQVAFEET